MPSDYWRRCGPCKREITFKSQYYHCSQSNCRKHAFCSKECWGAHQAMMRHKEAWPEQAIAPTESESNRKIVASPSQLPNDDMPKEILIVASKLKLYIKSKSGMNTSASVMERLSDMVRLAADKAIIEAQNDGRKTVLDRDFH